MEWTRASTTTGCSGNPVRSFVRDMLSMLSSGRSEADFRQRCRERLEKLADVAIDTRKYDEAIERFSAMLLLDPVDRVDILIRRSKVQQSMRLWEEALSDADEVSFAPHAIG